MNALDKLIEAVEAGKLVSIPTPHLGMRERDPDVKARIMAYSEGYIMARHKGALPFVVSVRETLKYLRAYRSQHEAGE